MSQIGELAGAAADCLRGHGGEPLTGRRVARRSTQRRVVSISPVMVSRSRGGGESERLTTGR
jgi:hypothetical protein